MGSSVSSFGRWADSFSESWQAVGIQGVVWFDFVRLGEESVKHIIVELNLQNCRT